jgi:hypothetical protein
MQKNRRPRFRTHDIRALEELVWRDLNAAVRAANERVAREGSGRRPLHASAEDRTPSPAVQPADATEAPTDVPDAGNEAASLAVDEPTSTDASQDLAAQEHETIPLDASDEIESVTALIETGGDAAAVQWSNVSDEQFLDGVAEWLNRQARPDQMIAEIWCRLLALQVPAAALDAVGAARRFQ